MRGRVSLFLSNQENKNPHVLLENAKIDLKNLRKQNTELLTNVLTVSERLKRQINVLNETCTSLKSSITLSVSNSNTELASEQALLHEETQKELAEKTLELEANEQTYQNLLEVSKLQEKKFARDIEQLSNLVCKAEAEEAKALITESVLQVPSSRSLNDLEVNKSKLQEAINSQLDRSKARIQIANDSVNQSLLRQEEQVRKNKQAAALQRFLNK